MLNIGTIDSTTMAMATITVDKATSTVDTMAILCPTATTTTECGREMLRLCLRPMLMPNTMDTSTIISMAILCPTATTTTECGREMLRLYLRLMLMPNTMDTSTNGMETNTM